MSGGTDGRPLILLVEDNQTIRQAFTVLLEDSGYRVLAAGSGKKALALSRNASPDLILMDLGLPDARGLDLVRSLKQKESTVGIPVVAITGRALETDEEACLEAGCAGYLTKPVNTRQLLALIPTYLEG
ncbi:MAG: response regulator [Longimicrobiaceae bacterium]